MGNRKHGIRIFIPPSLKTSKLEVNEELIKMTDYVQNHQLSKQVNIGTSFTPKLK